MLIVQVQIIRKFGQIIYLLYKDASFFVIEEKTGPPLTILFDYDLVDILIFSSETSVLNDLLHGLGLYIKSCPFSTYFSAGSFIGGGNWSTQRKPPTYCMSLTKLMLYRVHLTMNRIQTHNFSGDRL